MSRRGRQGSTGSRDGEGAETDWVARLADDVIDTADRRTPGRPVLVASGISPSGPIHLGNLREIMVPHLVADEIRRRGRQCIHHLSWDDYDRFRKVPAAIEGIESWAEHIGRPLTSVPPPPGSPHATWADHFRSAMESSLDELGVIVRGVSQTHMYTSGAYRDSVLLAMRERHKIDEVLGRYRTKAEPARPGDGSSTVPEAALREDAAAAAQTSGAADEDDGTSAGEYFPYQPYCHVCERDLTTVTAYDDDTHVLDYDCACGHSGSMNLESDFHGKLVWKVDWPMRWAFETVVFEPSGVDHQSPGSSYVVGGEIVSEVFGGERPIGPMYAFVGISGMAKMSSSKGGVPTPGDALEIMEPHLLRWLYARRRPSQSFMVAFDNEIHRLYDEWDALARKVASGAGQPGDNAMVARSVRTSERELPMTAVPLAYRALASVVDLTGGHEDQMLRIVASMDARVAALDDVRPRLDRAATWVETQADPEDRTVVLAEPDAKLLGSLDAHQNDALDRLAAGLDDHWSLHALTSLVYGIPKVQAGFDVAEKKLPPGVKADQRAFFVLLYRLLVGTDTGPRLPTLLLCIGPDRVRRLVGRA